MTFNHGVEGSSPSALTNKIRCLAEDPRFTKCCDGKSSAAQPRAIAHPNNQFSFMNQELNSLPYSVICDSGIKGRNE